jgi:DNA-binding NtrC family response regulator
LQEGCLQRLGGKENVPLDVRVIAATHRDLEAAIQQRQFREDLYYRLNVVVIAVPPLRQRREDVPALIGYFLQKHGPPLGVGAPSIHPQAVEFLQSQPWPGNVRELENVVRKALLLAQNYTINLEHVRAALNQTGPSTFSGSFVDFVDSLLAAAQRGEAGEVHASVMETAERELITRAIALAQGNQAKAARWLGITRVTMKAKLVQFGLRSDSESEPTEAKA